MVSAGTTPSRLQDEGTRSPSQTLLLGRGTCRDLATLFVEAVLSLGFGARVVSG